MLDRMKRVLGRGDDDCLLHECRRCGTTVETPDETCPACDSAEIATVRTN